MKKSFYLSIFIFLICLFISCNFYPNINDSGSFSIALPGTSNTSKIAQPPESYVVKLNGKNNSYNFSETYPASSKIVLNDIPAGAYELFVHGENDKFEFENKIDINVVAGETTRETINLNTYDKYVYLPINLQGTRDKNNGLTCNIYEINTPENVQTFDIGNKAEASQNSIKFDYELKVGSTYVIKIYEKIQDMSLTRIFLNGVEKFTVTRNMTDIKVPIDKMYVVVSQGEAPSPENRKFKTFAEAVSAIQQRADLDSIKEYSISVNSGTYNETNISINKPININIDNARGSGMKPTFESSGTFLTINNPNAVVNFTSCDFKPKAESNYDFINIEKGILSVKNGQITTTISSPTPAVLTNFVKVGNGSNFIIDQNFTNIVLPIKIDNGGSITAKFGAPISSKVKIILAPNFDTTKKVINTKEGILSTEQKDSFTFDGYNLNSDGSVVSTL